MGKSQKSHAFLFLFLFLSDCCCSFLLSFVFVKKLCTRKVGFCFAFAFGFLCLCLFWCVLSSLLPFPRSLPVCDHIYYLWYFLPAQKKSERRFTCNKCLFSQGLCDYYSLMHVPRPTTTVRTHVVVFPNKMNQAIDSKYRWHLDIVATDPVPVP